MLTTTVPVDVTPEAAARIAELGIRSEAERMIDQAVKTVNGIRRIEISLLDPNEMYDEPHLSASAYRDPTLFGDQDQERYQFRDWVISAFSPDVLWYFCLHIWPDAPRAG